MLSSGFFVVERNGAIHDYRLASCFPLLSLNPFIPCVVFGLLVEQNP